MDSKKMNAAAIQVFITITVAAQTLDQQVRRADDLLRQGAYEEVRVELSRILEKLDPAKPHSAYGDSA